MNSFSWNDCGEASYPGHLKSLTLTPDPLDLPGNVSVGFSGILNVSLASPIVVSTTNRFHLSVNVVSAVETAVYRFIVICTKLWTVLKLSGKI